MIKFKIFSECGPSIGYGHIARCSSLYSEIAARGLPADFYIDGDISGVKFLQGIPVQNVNWLDIAFLANEITVDDLVIIDSYQAEPDVYELISRLALRAIFIDDFARLPYPKGIIVNPSLNISDLQYDLHVGSQLLAGPDYVILRPSFVKASRKHLKKKVEQVLLIMGGTDVRNLTSLIVDSFCPRYPEILFDVVIGQNFADQPARAKDYPNVRYHVNVTENEMCQLMLSADLAITAAGQTIYELMATLTPFIAIKTIDNQQNNARTISEMISPQIILDYAEHYLLKNLLNIFAINISLKNRMELVRRIERLIDGQGSKRIIDALIDVQDPSLQIRLRVVSEHDMQDVFELSNQDYVRQYSINQEKIDWADHVNWFLRILQDDQVTFYVVTDQDDSFLGQIRFALHDRQATVSISLSDEIRGKGLSKMLLYQAMEKLLAEHLHIKEIVAYVSENNIASSKLFEQLNFCKISNDNGLLKFVIMRGD